MEKNAGDLGSMIHTAIYVEKNRIVPFQDHRQLICIKLAKFAEKVILTLTPDLRSMSPKWASLSFADTICNRIKQRMYRALTLLLPC
jgi:hypothetical protein